eukprot:3152671-Ditylum_brightwellii.AAC.1
MEECNFVQAYKKHVQPTQRITEQQRLWQVQFVKDTKRQAKKCGLSAKEERISTHSSRTRLMR